MRIAVTLQVEFIFLIIENHEKGEKADEKGNCILM